MTTLSTGWKLEVAKHVFIAIRHDGIGEYIQGAKTMNVPCTPTLSSKLYLWHEQALPVIDLNALIFPKRATIEDPAMKLVILRFNGSGQSTLVALRLENAPERLSLSEYETMTNMDNIPAVLRAFCLSVMQKDHEHVSILNFPQLLDQVNTLQVA